MSGTRQLQDDPVPSNEVRAKAAAWIARLHDEQRRPELEAELQAWLGESEEHRRAFNRMTQVWDRPAKIRMRARGDLSATRKERRSRFTPWAAALAASLVLVVVATIYY